MMYWLAVGVSCVAVGIVLIGWGYLVGLKVENRRAAGLVADLLKEIEQDRNALRARVRRGGVA